TKPQLVKVGALCIKKEGAHFDTPSFLFLYIIDILLTPAFRGLFLLGCNMVKCICNIYKQ
ncbi:hypothetical protein NSB03_18975, partial [Bacteroides acidifaciens]|nr:hypothetical protein [Bacteroides acidifaciens]